MEWILSLFLTGYGQRSRTSFVKGARPLSIVFVFNPLSGDAPYFSILLCLTPDDFTHQGEWRLMGLISTFIGENAKFFFMHMLEKDVLLL